MKISSTPWTLKKQLRTLLILSGLTVVLLLFFGGWRLQQFNKKDQGLQQSAQSLRHELESNFDNARLLTDIQTNLRKYTQSASPSILHKIHILAEKLHAELPKSLKPQFNDFLKKLDILEIRMNSFRQNNEDIYLTERDIMQSTDDLQQNVPVKYHREIRQLSSQACLKHHNLYIGVILTDNPDNLDLAAQEYEQLFTHIEDTVSKFANKLPPDNSARIKKHQSTFYELDESVSTIIAIRQVTLETHNDININLAALRDAVTDDSLTQANFLALLTQSGLTFLKNNLITMTIIMIVLAFLGGVTALVLNQTMVKPLSAFTTMLQRMTRMLSGLRKETEFEEDFSALLGSLTDHREDEIGQVATAVTQLLTRLRELAIFRQDIEADETSEEVFHRLGRIFSERLQLTSFVIFELTQNGETMRPVHTQLQIDDLDLTETSLTDECRARRNGIVISSLKDAYTCSVFPRPDAAHHVCIPMQISGQVIGLVQFLFPPVTLQASGKQYTESLLEARHYIAEALPVLHAKRLTLRLQTMATEDQLTGLFNRHYLESSLDRLVAGVKRRGGNICFMMCDLDHFKDVNDTYGHDAGDLVLSQLAKILLNSVRETDLVIRFGGEEFLILLVDCDTPTSCEMAERIRQSVESYKFHIHGNSIQMTLSIGTATFAPPYDKDIWNIFKYADVAMYQAKQNGRNQIVRHEDAGQHRPTVQPADIAATFT